MAWRPKAGGWRARTGVAAGGGGGKGAGAAAPRTGGRNKPVEMGEVLRISTAGFGFVGEGPNARKRLHFHFKDVMDNLGSSLKTGMRVSYKTRMNDDTMEHEAVEVRLLNPPKQLEASRAKSSKAVSIDDCMMTRDGTGVGKQNRFANVSKKVSNKSQSTGQGRNQFGDQISVDSG